VCDTAEEVTIANVVLRSRYRRLQVLVATAVATHVGEVTKVTTVMFPRECRKPTGQLSRSYLYRFHLSRYTL
jgi:hypothetical protein